MADETRCVWGKPKLIAVGRNRPEESVLSFCKTYYAGGGDPGAFNESCAYSPGECGNCAVMGDS